MTNAFEEYATGFQPIDWENFLTALRYATDNRIQATQEQRDYNVVVVHPQHIYVHVKSDGVTRSQKLFIDIDAAFAFIRADIEQYATAFKEKMKSHEPPDQPPI